MNWMKRVFTVTGAIVAVALMIAVVAPKQARGVANALVHVTNTAANPVPIVAPTHLGVRPSALVTLNCSTHTLADGVAPCDQLVKDGSFTQFIVPGGQALIVTDVNWYVQATPVPPCSTGPAQLFVGYLGTPTRVTPEDVLNAEWDGYCKAIGSVQYTSGLVFHSGETPAVLPNPLADMTRTEGIVYVSMHGYLTIDD